MKIKAGSFCFTFPAEDAAFAQCLADRAGKLWQEWQGRLGFCMDGSREVAVEVCGSVEAFLQSTGKAPEAYREWMVGNCDHHRCRLSLLSPRVSVTHTAAELEKVFVHELIHLLFDLGMAGVEAPIWCAEGVAVLYAEQIWVGGLSVAECPSIASLQDEDAFAELGGYDYAGAYVWYFIRQYGFERFLALYRGESAATALLGEGFEQRAVQALRAAVLPQKERTGREIP